MRPDIGRGVGLGTPLSLAPAWFEKSRSFSENWEWGIVQSMSIESEFLPVGNIDPGPLVRFEAVKAASSTASVVFQRVSEGETLGQIAKAWGIPKGAFTEWYMTQHGERYDAALKVRADQDAHETVAIADATVPQDVGPAKLMIDARKWRSSRWDRQRYGEHTKVEHSGQMTNLIAVLSSLPNRGAAPEEKEVPAEPDEPGLI